jgi:hypothetical protein
MASRKIRAKGSPHPERAVARACVEKLLVQEPTPSMGKNILRMTVQPFSSLRGRKV